MMKKQRFIPLIVLVLAVIGCGVYFYTHSTSYILRKNNGGHYFSQDGAHYSTVYGSFNFPLESEAHVNESLITPVAPYELSVIGIQCSMTKQEWDDALFLLYRLTNNTDQAVQLPIVGTHVEQNINGNWYYCIPFVDPVITESPPIPPGGSVSLAISLAHLISQRENQYRNFLPGQYRVLCHVDDNPARYVPLEFTLTRAQIRAAERAWREEKRQAAK